MKKAQIIIDSVNRIKDCGAEAESSQWTGPDGSYGAYLANALEQELAHLSADSEILACSDFAHTGVTCCLVCHDEYPDEMELVGLQQDSRAWLCCAMRRALGS